MQALRWDVFCHVVDNFGDIGFCWRLACGLAGQGQSVRLFVDDARALAWMAPQGCVGVQVHPLAGLGPGAAQAAYEPGDVVLAAFGCALPATVLQALQRAGQGGAGAAPRHIPWIHLEYLSAEAYAAHSHGLDSPVLGGAAAGIHRRFYFPGFDLQTGGLLREPGLMSRRQRFDRGAWLAARGIGWNGETVLSLFCYEPPLLRDWLAELAGSPLLLMVTDGRATAAVRRALAALPPEWNREGRLRIHFLPALTQPEFDHLLWCADGNFVRGEDSLVRAVWAGAGLVWQAYPQDQDAHRDKLEAFLDWMQAPEDLQEFSRCWNGICPAPLPPARWDAWGEAVRAARGRLLAQDDLVSRLMRFVSQKNVKIQG